MLSVNFRELRLWLTGGQGVAGSNPVIPTNVDGPILVFQGRPVALWGTYQAPSESIEPGRETTDPRDENDGVSN